MVDELNQLNGDESWTGRIVEADGDEAAREGVDLCVANTQQRAARGRDAGRRRARGLPQVDAKLQQVAGAATKALLVGGAEAVDVGVDRDVLLLEEAQKGDAGDGILA